MKKASQNKLNLLRILIKETGETFSLKNVTLSLNVKDLKGILEFTCGLPFNIQRLSYLDDGDLRFVFSKIDTFLQIFNTIFMWYIKFWTILS